MPGLRSKRAQVRGPRCSGGPRPSATQAVRTELLPWRLPDPNVGGPGSPSARHQFVLPSAAPKVLPPLTPGALPYPYGSPSFPSLSHPAPSRSPLGCAPEKFGLSRPARNPALTARGAELEKHQALRQRGRRRRERAELLTAAPAARAADRVEKGGGRRVSPARSARPASRRPAPPLARPPAAARYPPSPEGGACAPRSRPGRARASGRCANIT